MWKIIFDTFDKFIVSLVGTLLIYWIGRIDGFSQSRDSSWIDIKISNGLLCLKYNLIIKPIEFLKRFYRFFRK
uniref:Uncharacterized protein n=1 Tax=Staphylococcus aureus TaxID=1280 RepID=A0A0C6ERV5_STAAU|nr:phage protein [Staphylococcus aureus]